MAEADRHPLNEALRGPIVGSTNYIRSGSRVPPGGMAKVEAPEVEEVEEAEEAPKKAK